MVICTLYRFPAERDGYLAPMLDVRGDGGKAAA
jgi:hypothetical protein